MSATIFRHEFTARLRSVLIWSAAIAVLVFLFYSLFPGFADQAALINQMWAKFPVGLRAAFGMDKLDMSTVLGFYGFLMFFVQLFFAIQAGNYGFGLLSVEEAELTADFLLTKPVSRTQVYLSKLLSALAGLALTILITWAASLIAIAVFRGSHPYDAGTLWLIMLTFPLFVLIFLGIGLAVSLLVKRVRSVTPYSLGLAFGAYVLGAFSGVLGEVSLELLTPFKHFDPSYIIKNGYWNTPLVLLDVAVALIAIGLSYVLYLRRDIPAVS